MSAELVDAIERAPRPAPSPPAIESFQVVRAPAQRRWGPQARWILRAPSGAQMRLCHERRGWVAECGAAAEEDSPALTRAWWEAWQISPWSQWPQLTRGELVRLLAQNYVGRVFSREEEL